MSYKCNSFRVITTLHSDLLLPSNDCDGRYMATFLILIKPISFGHTHSIVDPNLIFSIRFTKPPWSSTVPPSLFSPIKRFSESDTKDQVRIRIRWKSVVCSWSFTFSLPALMLSLRVTLWWIRPLYPPSFLLGPRPSLVGLLAIVHFLQTKLVTSAGALAVPLCIAINLKMRWENGTNYAMT